MPLVCRVCNEVFPDNASLARHSRSHLRGEIPSTGQDGRMPPSVQSSRPSSSNLAGSSHPVDGVTRAFPILSPGMPNLARECSSSLPSVETPNTFPRGVGRTLPDLNSNTFPLVSLGSHPRFRSTHLDNAGSSSSRRPSFNSSSGSCSLSLSLAGIPSNDQSKGDQALNSTGGLPSKDPQSDIAMLIKSVEDTKRKNKRKMESDSEGATRAEDAGKKNKENPGELDLTLKL